jgi:PAS domain-containing protein
MRKGIFRWMRFNSINQKIIAGFLFIYLFFISNAVISILTLDRGAKSVRYASEVVNPLIFHMNEFRLMLSQSQIYIQNWVYDQERQQDRDRLKKIHLDYPEFRDNLQKLVKRWEDPNVASKMDSIIVQFDILKKKQEEIMAKLAEPDDYLDKIHVFDATKLLKQTQEKDREKGVLQLGENIITQTDFFINQLERNRETTESGLLISFEWQIQLTLILGIVLIFVGFGVSWWTRRQIVNPIKYINSVFIKLGTGELPEDRHYKFNKDEIGEMASSADKLVFNLKATSSFAERIGKGDYSAEYQPLSDKDVLGNALIGMRNNLSQVAEDDRRRSWANEGLVKFSELLKQHNSDISKLSDVIISNLVKYVKANQGALFIVETPESTIQNGHYEPYMTLSSCYAWDKKKFIEQKIYKGDGLAGQAWQEQGTIYMEDVPEGYVQITSGLGEANPSSILIVPLKVNEEIFGVIEIASFNIFERYEIEFVEKVAESIASSLSTVRINEKTQRLLEESTMMTEQMKSQEEEMRQNMEELQSTQEHIERSSREYKEKEALFNFAYLMIETDKKFSIKIANEIAESKLKYDSIDFEGMPIDYLFVSYEKVEEAKTKLEKGAKWVGFGYIKNKLNQKLFMRVSASPVRDEYGNVTKFLFVLDDITEAKS